ncbi:hypothetical protein GGI17_003908 [Coemansia sp. S146]|nr:hypothetical protein GGI17_003908 [Coemansia sp. S146]
MDNYLGHPTQRLARELEIKLNEDDVYSGEALNVLSHEPFNRCAFPLARNITFFIVLSRNIQTVQPVVAENISAFVQRIKQMASMAKAFPLHPKAGKGIIHSVGLHFNLLVTQLFQIVGLIEYGYTSTYSDIRGLQLNKVRDQTSIKHTTGNSIDTFHRLTRRNAPTLECLHTSLSSAHGVSSIIQDTDSA